MGDKSPIEAHEAIAIVKIGERKPVREDKMVMRACYAKVKSGANGKSPRQGCVAFAPAQ